MKRIKALNALVARNQRYAAASGAGYNDEEAQVLGGLMEHMRLQGVEVTPHNLLQIATPPESPIHKHFTWDESKAADEWRKQEARHILNHLVIVMPTPSGPVTRKACFSITVSAEPSETRPASYYHVGEIAGDDELKSHIRDNAWKELRAWVSKYGHFNFQEFEAIERFVNEHRK